MSLSPHVYNHVYQLYPRDAMFLVQHAEHMLSVVNCMVNYSLVERRSYQVLST